MEIMRENGIFLPAFAYLLFRDGIGGFFYWEDEKKKNAKTGKEFGIEGKKNQMNLVVNLAISYIICALVEQSSKNWCWVITQ